MQRGRQTNRKTKNADKWANRKKTGKQIDKHSNNKQNRQVINSLGQTIAIYRPAKILLM